MYTTSLRTFLPKSQESHLLFFFFFSVFQFLNQIWFVGYLQNKELILFAINPVGLTRLKSSCKIMKM